MLLKVGVWALNGGKQIPENGRHLEGTAGGAPGL